jgi:antitoxin HicB
MNTYAYPSKIVRAREGGWLITFRDFPEGHSQAEEGQDVIDIAEGLLQACVEARLLDGIEVPEPSATRTGEVVVGVPLETATKAALFSAVAATGDSRLALAKALRMDEKEVRRMLDPRHPSKLPRLARVLKALGKELRVTMVDATKPPVSARSGGGAVEARERRAIYKVRRPAPRRKLFVETAEGRVALAGRRKSPRATSRAR